MGLGGVTGTLRNAGRSLSKVFTPVTVFEGLYELTGMVDRPAREAAIAAIRRFRDGATSDDEFVDEYPGRSRDAAVGSIWSALWYSYDDLSKHRLGGRYALSPESLRGYNRCILFLAMDAEYLPRPGLLGRLVALVTGSETVGTSKDSPVWPFPSWDAYEDAVGNLGRAGAAERGADVEHASACAEIEGHRRA